MAMSVNVWPLQSTQVFKLTHSLIHAAGDREGPLHHPSNQVSPIFSSDRCLSLLITEFAKEKSYIVLHKLTGCLFPV